MAQRAPKLAAGAFIAALAIAPVAHAQLSEGGGPVSYSADNLEYFDGERRLVLTGDVDVVQGDARLRSDRLTLFFAPAAAGAAPAGDAGAGGLGSGDIQRMIAEGEVFYVRPAQSARGNRAVYETRNDSVVFTGNVVVAGEDSVVRGETLTLQISNRRTIIRPARGERVQGVFTPRNSGESGAN
jgi:lipopolysaccharide export system protein LptA